MPGVVIGFGCSQCDEGLLTLSYEGVDLHDVAMARKGVGEKITCDIVARCSKDPSHRQVIAIYHSVAARSPHGQKILAAFFAGSA